MAGHLGNRSLASAHIGGYDYQFVNGLPSDDYTCLICTLVARAAQQASCCGKIFCKQCLETLATAKCPNCREDLKGNYFPDKRAIRNIYRLKVYCDNREGGCSWKGELRRADAHHDSCPHRTVQCQNQCTQVTKSMDLPQHLEMLCPNQEIKCLHCGETGYYHHIITDHLEKCPDLRIACPNSGCRVKPKRKSIELHRQECPKEIVSCEYADLGCEHVCLREDMLQHNTQQVYTHLQLAAVEARSARKEASSASEKASDAIKEAMSAANELKTVRTLVESRAETPQKHILKMATYFKLKFSGMDWYSPPFFTFPGGYKMCLRVDAGGYGSGKGTHLSFFLCLMAGENDEILEWPMRGTFSVELLNQERDENHKEQFVNFTETEATTYNSKVSKGLAASGYGAPTFVSHKDLEDESLSSQTRYLKDNVLYFRVVMTKLESSSKPWLAGALS